jgi:hypothetical protein
MATAAAGGAKRRKSSAAAGAPLAAGRSRLLSSGDEAAAAAGDEGAFGADGLFSNASLHLQAAAAEEAAAAAELAAVSAAAGVAETGTARSADLQRLQQQEALLRPVAQPRLPAVETQLSSIWELLGEVQDEVHGELQQLFKGHTWVGMVSAVGTSKIGAAAAARAVWPDQLGTVTSVANICTHFLVSHSELTIVVDQPCVRACHCLLTTCSPAFPPCPSLHTHTPG